MATPGEAATGVAANLQEKITDAVARAEASATGLAQNVTDQTKKFGENTQIFAGEKIDQASKLFGTNTGGRRRRGSKKSTKKNKKSRRSSKKKSKKSKKKSRRSRKVRFSRRFSLNKSRY